jgi:putative membrane protein
MTSETTQHPQPGSRSEGVSAIKDALGGALGKAMAAAAVKTETFIGSAVASTHYEIEAAQLALRRSARADVKEFAQRMIDDHSKIGNELRTLLASTGKPTPPSDDVDRLHRVLLEDLHGVPDADFDKRYIAQQKLAHSEAITLFKTYMKHGDDAQLQGLCGRGLPIIEGHARMVEQLQRG